MQGGTHGWAGQLPRRHRERDVGGVRDGVRCLSAGGPKGIGNVPVGEVAGPARRGVAGRIESLGLL